MATAKTTIMDPVVVLSTVGDTPTEYDITDQVSKCEVMEEATVLTRTTFGDRWHGKGRGLKSGSLKLDFYIDFEPDGIFDIFTDLWNDETNDGVVAFSLTDPVTGAGVSGHIVLSNVPSFSGAIDEYSKNSSSWETTGPIVHTKAGES